jgi:PAS domain S-box-containing protein
VTRKDEEDRLLHSVALQNAESIRIARRRAEQQTETTLWEQANLLNLTHDSIFVRNMNGAIRYWNRAAEELYGWTSEEAVGRHAHELLKTVFPAPLGQIEEEVTRAGHWEGELVHTKKDGSQVVVASRWSLQRDDRGAPVAVLETNNDITERKRVKEGLRRSEKLIQTFWENSPNLIFLKDAECRYLFVNKKFEEALHVRQEQIQGLRDDEIFPSQQAAAFRVNDRKVLETLVPMEFEETAQQEDGPHVSIVQKFPLFDAEGKAYAIGGVVTDITERKRTEAELLALKNELAEELMAMTRLHEFSTRLLATTELSPLLDEVLHATIAMQNADFGNIQLYNPETKALEIVAHRGFQRDFLDHFRSVHDTGAACGRALQLGKRVVIEDVQIDPDYEPHREIAAAAGFRAVQSTPLFSRSGEFLGMVSTHFRAPHRPSERDLRLTDLYVRHAAEMIERKRAEAERKRAEEERERLRLLEADLAHINRVSMIGELAASLAHEIRQPITAAMADAKTGLRWLAGEVPDLQEAREAMMRVVKDAARAAEIINHLRSFYKKDTPLERELVDVNEVAHEIIGLLYSEANRYSISMRTELAAELPRTKADRVQLQQVFMNLMLNGIEAMKETAGELAIKSCQTADSQVLISISDTGVGLPVDKLEQIFSAFYTTKPQGTGMGLAITRSIIESHGGRLWATANPERGATFHFTLPTETKRLGASWNMIH